MVILQNLLTWYFYKYGTIHKAGEIRAKAPWWRIGRTPGREMLILTLVFSAVYLSPARKQTVTRAVWGNRKRKCRIDSLLQIRELLPVCVSPSQLDPVWTGGWTSALLCLCVRLSVHVCIYAAWVCADCVFLCGCDFYPFCVCVVFIWLTANFLWNYLLELFLRPW